MEQLKGTLLRTCFTDEVRQMLPKHLKILNLLASVNEP